MHQNKLSKYEALKLITPVVDNEVCEEKRQAFFDYIAKDDDVRRKYESVKNVKSLIGTRCPCSNAPKSLRDGIKKLLEIKEND